MKRAKAHIKRRLQTFRFKGREPRGLYWKKDIYREWFEWAKLAGNYPDDWGCLEEFADFEAWWRHPQYGFELFCEPPEKPPIAELECGDDIPVGALTVTIDRYADPEKALVMLRNLLRKRLKPRADYSSHARYSPSKDAKYIKLDVLRRYRLAHTLKEIEGFTRKEIAPELMRLRKSKQLPDMRVITRDLTTAKKILENVKRGVFPGDVD